MNSQPLQFYGLEPWPSGVEIVECVAAGRTIDVHNDCTLEEAAISCTPVLELWFRLVEDKSADRIQLGFAGVRHLSFTQDDRAAAPASWEPAGVETFIGAQYVTTEDGEARFTVETIVGTFDFTCTAVILR